MQVPYSHDLMVKIMPDWLVENYKTLEEKLQDIILMRRGLLIPHPRDEYDLLEERILESLELKMPRLLKCGHFVPPEDDSDKEEEDDTASVNDDCTGRGSRMSGGTLNDESKWGEHMDVHDRGMCTDCHRELKRPGKGVGAGTRRWDIKIYAANGLMRAAAWSACWHDMERCDVEISPWVPDEIRKMLERRAQEEQEAEKRKQLYAAELQRQILETGTKQRILEEEAAERKRLEEVELQKSFDAAAAALQKSVEEKAAEKKKFEETLKEKIEEAKASVRLELEAHAHAESDAIAERFRTLEGMLQQQLQKTEPAVETQQEPAASKATSARRQPRATDIPLGTLLKNYVLVLLGDQRNLVILVLSALVIFLSMNMDSSWKTQFSSNQRVLMTDESTLLDAVAPVAVTATTTATSFSTLTVTEIRTAERASATEVPSLDIADVSASAIESSIVAEESFLPIASAPSAEAKQDALLTPTLDICLVQKPFLAVCAKQNV